MNSPHPFTSSTTPTSEEAGQDASSSIKRRPLALSPWRATDCKQGPLLYRLRAIDRLPEPKTNAEVKGTLVHAALEKTHELQRAERTYPRAGKFLKTEWEKMCADDAELVELVPHDQTLDFLIEARDL